MINENQTWDIVAKLNESIALNDSINEFIEEMQQSLSVNYVNDKSERILYFSNMLDEHLKQIKNELENSLSCQQN